MLIRYFAFIFLFVVSSCQNLGELEFKLKGDSLFQIKEQKVELKDLKATYTNVYKNVLLNKCIGCHGDKRSRADVNLEHYELVFDWSEYFVPIVVKNEPLQSGLFLEIEAHKMPPKSPLSDEEIAFIKRWITEGALE